MRILLVEDEIHLAQALTEILKKNTYNADAVHEAARHSGLGHKDRTRIERLGGFRLRMGVSGRVS